MLDETKVWTGFEENATTSPFKEVRHDIKEVKVIDEVSPYRPSAWFCEFDHCERFDVLKLDVSRATDLNSFFDACIAAPEIDVTGWDTSNVKSMRVTFSGWASMTNKYYPAEEIYLTKIKGLDTWDVSVCSDFADTFSRNPKLASITGVERWNMSQATSIHHMFAGDISLKVKLYWSSTLSSSCIGYKDCASCAAAGNDINEVGAHPKGCYASTGAAPDLAIV